LEGRELREIVHYADSKDPRGRLKCSDGQVIELPFGGIEVVTCGAIRIAMERYDDRSYRVTYTGPSLAIAELWISYGTGTWAEEASRTIEEWIAGGLSGELNMVVDTRMALAAD
jgi:hypothetical protein